MGAGVGAVHQPVGVGGAGQGGFRTVWRCRRVDGGWVADFNKVRYSQRD